MSRPMMYLTIDPDRTRILYPDKLGDRPRYPAIKELVEKHLGVGVTFQHLRIKASGVEFDMLIDEEGHPKELPFNNLATMIYRENIRQRRQIPTEQDYITGRAILFDRKVIF